MWQRCIDQERVRAWVLEGMPPAAQTGPLTALGYERAGVLVAGFLFDNYRPEFSSVEFHTRILRPQASNGAFYRGILRDAAGYMFGQLACWRISAYIPRKNASSAKFLRMCGFRQEGILRQAFGDDDALLFALLAEEAPAWLFTPPPIARRMDASRVVSDPFHPGKKGEPTT